MNPLFLTDFSISDSLKSVRKSVLIYETIIKVPKRYIIRTVKFNVSADSQKSVEKTELFAHKIRTFKGEPQ